MRDERTSKILSQAQQEIADERFRVRVDAEKERILEYKPWWYRWFPWQITVTRR